MKVYKLKTDSKNYLYFDLKSIKSENVGKYDIITEYFRGKPMKKKWSPEVFTISKRIHYKKRNKLDFPDVQGIGGEPFISEIAIKSLDSLISNFCEYLPIIIEESPIKYYKINVIEKKDEALDFEKSEFEYWEHSPERIHYIKKFIFKEEKLKKTTIFKLELDHYVNIFVTDVVKNKVEDCNLKGFIFNEVWDSNE